MSITKPTPSTLRLLLSIKPNARSSSIVSVTDTAVSLRIRAPPREGEANVEVVRFLSKALGVPKSTAQIVKGSKGRDKVLLVEGVEAGLEVDDVRKKLEELVEE